MSETKKCPFCAEEINEAAIKCKHCGTDLTAPQISRSNVVAGFAIPDDKASLTVEAEPTFLFVVKSAFSAGLYAWRKLSRFILHRPNATNSVGLNEKFISILMYVFGASTLMYSLSYINVTPLINKFTGDAIIIEGEMVYFLGGGPVWFWLGELLSIAYGIMLMVSAFKLKPIVIAEAHKANLTNYQMNSFFLVIFNIFYINYCLNEIKEATGKS